MVEQVLVVRRQFPGEQGVFAADGDFLIAVRQQQEPETARVDGEVVLPLAVLNADLSQTGGTAPRRRGYMRTAGGGSVKSPP
ncbi:MAG: hypothetical protein H3C26_12745 [Rhodocyclaceae bacterium]|nr:hypothetical protein [Rhodocyclaceae bacterium]